VIEKHSQDKAQAESTRRRFLKQIGQGTVVGGVAIKLLQDADPAAAARTPTSKPATGKVKHRKLGKTGLSISEIGFGGHSWSYKQIRDGKGSKRKITIQEATEMIREGLEMGVNFFDSCTPLDECSIPGEALKRLKQRDRAIICVRVSHKMHGVPNDQKEVYKWLEDRLKLWQTDYIDLLMLSNESYVTKKSGYWDMTHSIEALDKLKQQGKIRFTGFGSHFTPKWFLEAFEKFSKYFDMCSMPYNCRHRVAEQVMPQAKKAGLGIITIKPFARGSLLKKRDLTGKDAGLPRDMIAFVLENKSVDCCICGVHTAAQMKENFSASWTKLSPAARQRLTRKIACIPCHEHAWLEQGWCHA
jgi:aryl-alcohol dehydrogenase-like predicted oxidoreductase